MKKTRIVVAIALVFAMMLSLVACGSAPLNDEGFIKNMQKGLEARWKLSQKQPDSYKSNTEKKEGYTQAVNSELKALGDISAYTFENAELKELAETYNKALQSQLEGIKYIGSDDAKYNEIYVEDGYYQRARVICKLADNFGLTVSKTYGDEMDQLVSAGRTRLALDEKVAAMEGIFANSLVLTCLGGQEYEFTITNTTKYDLSDVEIRFNFYDDKGVLIENKSAFMASWHAGNTNRCTIYTPKAFTRAEACVFLFDKTNQYAELKTSYHPVECVNDMKIEIVLKNELPCEISYLSWDKTVAITCKVTGFEYEESYWSDGEGTVKVKLAGTKTYDKEGDSNSRAALVGYKLYDENGIVVDSGDIWSSEITVGESFKDALWYLSKLAPGTYTIELVNAE